MTHAIGIDVGGTKIAAGVVDTSTGALEARFERGTRPERGSDAVLADCVALAQRLAAGREGLPIGMGVCELIDLDGHVQSAQTLEWRHVDLAGAFGDPGPAVVESDVRAAALAEARFGAGRGVEELLFAIVGTGISCCLVLGGRAYSVPAAMRSASGLRPSSRRPAGSPWPRPEDASGPRRSLPTRRSTAWSRRPQASSGSVSPGSSTRSTPGWS